MIEAVSINGFALKFNGLYYMAAWLLVFQVHIKYTHVVGMLFLQCYTNELTYAMSTDS